MARKHSKWKHGGYGIRFTLTDKVTGYAWSPSTLYKVFSTEQEARTFADKIIAYERKVREGKGHYNRTYTIERTFTPR